MKSPRFSRFVAGAFVTAAIASSFAAAQISAEKVAATNKILQQVKATINKMPQTKRQILGGYANISRLADVWNTYGMRLTDPTFVARANQAKNALMPARSSGIVPASNPSTDVAYSSFGGFTQSTTSTARCGDNIVVGFNDSGSVFETPYFFTGSGGESLSGSAYSTDGGASFSDIGPMNPGTDTANFVGGEPVATCVGPNTFYFTQIFDYIDSSGNPWAGVALNTSTDGGKTWGNPAAAISKSGFYHLLEKPWSTIDPSNHKRMFVSYTDMDFSNSSPYCGVNSRTAIEFVESDDGGVTWSSTPNIAFQVCGSAAVDVSQMAVGSNGTLYISWMNLGSNFPLGPRAIQISSYSSGTLSSPVTVNSAIQPGGDSYYLQGEFRDIHTMAMAVDHSKTSTDGYIYFAWADGRNKTVPDPFAIQGFYAYDDILLSASYDGGNTWGNPIKVNSDSQPRLGSGRDHYQPGIAVDNRGYVGVCWYDRRADNENFAIRRHCGESNNGGASFSDVDIGLPPFAPTHGGDLLLDSAYMGEYDQLTSDFLNINSGFIGAFQNQGARGNPNVFVHPMN